MHGASCGRSIQSTNKISARLIVADRREIRIVVIENSSINAFVRCSRLTYLMPMHVFYPFRLAVIACAVLMPLQAIASTCGVCWLLADSVQPEAADGCHCCQPTSNGEAPPLEPAEAPSEADCICQSATPFQRTVEVELPTSERMLASLLDSGLGWHHGGDHAPLTARVAESPPQSAPLIALTSRLLL